jgi:hypothetical protein
VKLVYVVRKLEKEGFSVETSSDLLVASRPGCRDITARIELGLVSLDEERRPSLSVTSFKVTGDSPDRPEYDDFSSFRTNSLAEAVRFSKSKVGAK